MTSPNPRKSQPAGKVPPPAKPSPGVRGTPPLPVGKLMQRTAAGVAPVSLTDIERRMLEEAGIQWKPGMRLPSNMAQILHDAKEQLGLIQQAAVTDATVNLPLPVDPKTPPLQVTTVPIEQLNPQQRAHYTAVVQGMMQQELAREEAEQQKRQELARMARLPQGVQQAAAQATLAAAKTQGQQPQGTPRPSPSSPRPRQPAAAQSPPLPVGPPDVVDDLALYEEVTAQLPPVPPAAPPLDPLRQQLAQQAEALQPGLAQQILGTEGLREPEATPQAAAQPPAAEAEPATEEDATGATTALTNCPHCNFPLDQEDIPEPPYADKMAFLHSVLGQKPYERTYQLLGGHVEVTFRSLTTQELDEIFKHAYGERAAGRLASPADFWERINRMRLCLQLLVFQANTFQHNLPDGLSRATNPNATQFWEDTDAVPEGHDPAVSLLPAVEEWLFQHVFRTETLCRMVTQVGNQFNRLTSKLEAMVDNADFWQATGESV